jgi:hypothetical protein
VPHNPALEQTPPPRNKLETPVNYGDDGIKVINLCMICENAANKDEPPSTPNHNCQANQQSTVPRTNLLGVGGREDLAAGSSKA